MRLLIDKKMPKETFVSLGVLLCFLYRSILYGNERLCQLGWAGSSSAITVNVFKQVNYLIHFQSLSQFGNPLGVATATKGEDNIVKDGAIQ